MLACSVLRSKVECRRKPLHLKAGSKPRRAHHIISGNANKTEPAKFPVVFIANDG
jgi:hypothetical protein